MVPRKQTQIVFFTRVFGEEYCTKIFERNLLLSLVNSDFFNLCEEKRVKWVLLTDLSKLQNRRYFDVSSVIVRTVVPQIVHKIIRKLLGEKRYLSVWSDFCRRVITFRYGAETILFGYSFFELMPDAYYGENCFKTLLVEHERLNSSCESFYSAGLGLRSLATNLESGERKIAPDSAGLFRAWYSDFLKTTTIDEFNGHSFYTGVRVDVSDKTRSITIHHALPPGGLMRLRWSDLFFLCGHGHYVTDRGLPSRFARRGCYFTINSIEDFFYIEITTQSGANLRFNKKISSVRFARPSSRSLMYELHEFTFNDILGDA
jgi:hypothetical protein